MIISIVDSDQLLDKSAAELAERRLLYALSRFDSRIESVEMVVQGDSEPQGEFDKVCVVSVKLRGAPIVVVADRDSQWCVCLSRIAHRTGRTVARSIERRQRHPHQPIPSRASSVLGAVPL